MLAFAKRRGQLWGGGPRLHTHQHGDGDGERGEKGKQGRAYRVIACLSRSAAPEDVVPAWEAMVGGWRVEGAVPTLRVERVGTRLLDLLRM